MKQCTKCQQWKDESEFGIEKRVQSGLKAKCIKCYNEYSRNYKKSEQGRRIKKEYTKTKKYKDTKAKSDKKYRQTKKGKESEKRGILKYRQTKKGKETSIRIINRYRGKFPERVKAHTVISNAKTAKIIPPASELVCSICKNIQAIHYHHPDYSKPLEVIPVCMKCHLTIHGR